MLFSNPYKKHLPLCVKIWKNGSLLFVHSRLQTGIYILTRKWYLFPPYFRKWFIPSPACWFSAPNAPRFAFFLPYFAFILSFYIPLSLLIYLSEGVMNFLRSFSCPSCLRKKEIIYRSYFITAEMVLCPLCTVHSVCPLSWKFTLNCRIYC
jgi:hypothetical protein